VSSSYLDLRRRLAARDRSLHEKVTSLEAAAELVKDGETVGIGGSTLSRTPMAMIWALIRARRRNLTCATGCSGRAPARTPSRAGSARASCGAFPR
jgi:acyl-CoA hydrolase